jgi:hypothetical protein
MKTCKLRPMALPVCGLMALMAAPARAEEGHTYTSEAAFKASFYLIGGQYEIYVNAAPSTVAAMSGASCLFNGNFQRVWWINLTGTRTPAIRGVSATGRGVMGSRRTR